MRNTVKFFFQFLFLGWFYLLKDIFIKDTKLII